MQIHFWTKDIDRAMRFYIETLGFSIAYSQPEGGPTDFCILDLAGEQVMFGIPPVGIVALERNDKPLMETVLQRIDGIAPLSIYIPVADVAQHYAHSTAHGADILEPLWKPQWGAPQYSLRDMDGHLLTFFGA